MVTGLVVLMVVSTISAGTSYDLIWKGFDHKVVAILNQ